MNPNREDTIDETTLEELAALAKDALVSVLVSERITCYCSRCLAACGLGLRVTGVRGVRSLSVR